jgi:hypothetical protein
MELMDDILRPFPSYQTNSLMERKGARKTELLDTAIWTILSPYHDHPLMVDLQVQPRVQDPSFPTVCIQVQSLVLVHPFPCRAPFPMEHMQAQSLVMNSHLSCRALWRCSFPCEKTGHLLPGHSLHFDAILLEFLSQPSLLLGLQRDAQPSVLESFAA